MTQSNSDHYVARTIMERVWEAHIFVQVLFTLPLRSKIRLPHMCSANGKFEIPVSRELVVGTPIIPSNCDLKPKV